MCAAERPNDGRTDGPTAIASLSHSLAAHTTTASTIPLSRTLSRLLARSRCHAGSASGGRRLCLWKRERRSLRPSLRPSDRSKATAAVAVARTERARPSHIFCAHRERSDRRIISEFTDYDSAASRVHDSVKTAMNRVWQFGARQECLRGQFQDKIIASRSRTVCVHTA